MKTCGVGGSPGCSSCDNCESLVAATESKTSQQRSHACRPHRRTHQRLRVPACPRRAGGHAWRLDRKRSTGEREADAAPGARAGADDVATNVNELPSVALTTRFLALCQQYGSEQLAVRIVAAGRSTGVPELPPNNDWTAWNAAQMRAAVEHLRRKLRP